MKKQHLLPLTAALTFAFCNTPLVARAQGANPAATTSNPPVSQEEPISEELTREQFHAVMLAKQKVKFAEASIYLKQGDELLAKGQNDAAIAAFRQGLAVDILSAIHTAYHGLIEAYTAKGDLRSVASVYRELLYPAPDKHWGSSNETDPLTLMRFALVLNQIGQKDEALTVYRQGLQWLNYPDGKTLTTSFPLLLDTTFDGRDSENVYTPARLEAAARTAIAMRTRLDSSVDGQAEAEAQLTKAIKANPRFGPAYLYRALALQMMVAQQTGSSKAEVKAAFDTAERMVHGSEAKAALKAARAAY